MNKCLFVYAFLVLNSLLMGSCENRGTKKLKNVEIVNSLENKDAVKTEKFEFKETTLKFGEGFRVVSFLKDELVLVDTSYNLYKYTILNNQIKKIEIPFSIEGNIYEYFEDESYVILTYGYDIDISSVILNKSTQEFKEINACHVRFYNKKIAVMEVVSFEGKKRIVKYDIASSASDTLLVNQSVFFVGMNNLFEVIVADYKQGVVQVFVDKKGNNEMIFNKKMISPRVFSSSPEHLFILEQNHLFSLNYMKRELRQHHQFVDKGASVFFNSNNEVLILNGRVARILDIGT